MPTNIKFSSGLGGSYDGKLGGPKGADALCQDLFGDGQISWRAMLVGGGRVASLTPFKGDGQQDWVVQKFTYYYNWRGDFIWRTDEIALLGVRNGQRLHLYSVVHDGRYPWSGWKTDWTAIERVPESVGNCWGWTSNSQNEFGAFVFDDLKEAAGEPCSLHMPILCVEQ